MDVRRLDLLRELAERGSITAVAAATHRTPSAVSQQLKVLEREAGLPLTERVGRGIQLTSAGHALARSAGEVAVALERATALWDEFRNHPSGEVRLATFPSAGQVLLPGVLQEVSRTPGLILSCADGDHELLDFPSLTADYDIVLAHSLRGARAWGGRGLRVVPLMTEALDIALPADHRLAGRSYLTAADVVDEPWIGVPIGFPFERILHDIEEAAGRRATIFQRISDLRMVEAFVAAGFGVSLIPRSTSGGIDPGRVILKPLRGVDSERDIVALLRPDTAERLAVRTVLSILQAKAAEIEAAHAAS
ncbi:LysR family transcriptional regulator [Microbacterium sp. ABRD28]|uniref:LysR family transcriptional regulator n=1 Tax=Microbacterium sp. ABRD28 TaxID=2268461 RepID=UPI000F54DE5F|nr:LysR family transcriptional regulator [Microbacterium sp. ABRD28]AZC13018.1 LysR family transcriptional regulator [Microbacterium sp. ABRD28]